MGFFAIIKTAQDDDFQIISCHINLWSLAGLFRRRCFYLDVGLRLRAGNKEVNTFEIALPVGVYDKDALGLRDLHNVLLDANVCQLIFGRQVTINADQGTLRYEASDGPTELRLTKLDTPACHRIEEYSAPTFSYWNIKLNDVIRRDPDTYLRMRFNIQNLGRTWIWKKSGFAWNGALIDMRITDLRESSVGNDWGPHPDRVVPIQQLNLFAIAPSWLQLRAVSPTYHYIRLFEGRIWEKYLTRAFDRRRKEKLIIYQWRNQNGPVGPANPFHAFIDFSQEFGLFRVGNHIRSAILVVLFGGAATGAVWFYITHRSNIVDVLQRIVSNRVITVTSVVAIVGGLLWVLFRYVERFQKLFKIIRNKFLAFEERHFRKRMSG